MLATDEITLMLRKTAIYCFFLHKSSRDFCWFMNSFVRLSVSHRCRYDCVLYRKANDGKVS